MTTRKRCGEVIAGYIHRREMKKGLRKLEVIIVRNDDTEVLIDEQYNDNDLPLNLLFVRFPLLGGFLKVSIKEAEGVKKCRLSGVLGKWLKALTGWKR